MLGWQGHVYPSQEYKYSVKEIQAYEDPKLYL